MRMPSLKVLERQAAAAEARRAVIAERRAALEGVAPHADPKDVQSLAIWLTDSQVAAVVRMIASNAR